MRTEVVRQGRPPVQIDYGDGEDAVRAGRPTTSIVGGVSLVTNYRDEFNEQIKAGGVDGLIKTLAAQEPGRRRRSERRATATRRAGAFAATTTASAGRSPAR